MRRRAGLLAGAGLAGWMAGLDLRAQQPASAPAAGPQAAAPRPLGELKSLGQDRFQIGRVIVDKRAGSFIVPGRVHVTGKPLEYLATSPNGRKAYETLLELDATGSEFNLACILIGLERDPNQVPLGMFRRSTLIGPKVSLFITWTDGGKTYRMSAAEALLDAEAGHKADSVEWVYTGSPVSDPSRPFAADRTGSLIGFIHDVTTVIEATAFIGFGAYGSVRGNPALPPVGTAVELIVEAVKLAK